MAVGVILLLETERQLPADRWLPIERPLTGLKGCQVKSATGACMKVGPIQEDASVLDQAGGLVVFAPVSPEAITCFRDELPVVGGETFGVLLDSRQVFIIEEPGSHRAASLLHLRGRRRVDPLTPVAVDAGPR